MKTYVLGFLFDKYMCDILLMEKKRGPAHIIGKLNGVGGSVEKGEAPLEAMIREGIEESGLTLEWKCFGLLKTKFGDVYLYACASNDIYNFKQLEDEYLRRYLVNEVKMYEAAENLCWMIPMAIGCLKGDFHNEKFTIEEG